jgi:hypothetical protein
MLRRASLQRAQRLARFAALYFSANGENRKTVPRPQVPSYRVALL